MKIAEEIGISRSTLYDELSCGTVEQMDTNLVIHKEYLAEARQANYEKHRANSRKQYKFVKVYEFIKYAQKEILERKFSSDVVCGVAKKNGLK